MKGKLAALLLVIGIFSGVSRADSACQTGLFANLLGTSCTIGDKTFTFTTSYGASDPSILNTLFFTPESTSTSAGFNISGFPAAVQNSGGQAFLDVFTAVPYSGTVTSFTATINGESVDPSGGEVFAELSDLTGGTPNTAYDEYVPSAGVVTEFTGVGGPEAAFGTSFPGGGSFQLFDVGTASFTSADFVFNESTSRAVPEGSQLEMLEITGAGLLVALRRKFLQRSTATLVAPGS